MKNKWMICILVVLLSFASVVTGCTSETIAADFVGSKAEYTLPQTADTKFSVNDVPAYMGEAYVSINDNQPYFVASDLTETAFERYSPLDWLGRCGTAYANIGQELMPTEERGSIGQVKPTGWHTVKYDFVDGKYLYNRCHLIGYQLTAENANQENLITGTRYLNIEGMLPFENMVADYVKETGNHVLYRVTPVYQAENLVASGVLMEGYSVEDAGEGICFCVYAYNVQPGIEIDYTTGESNISGAQWNQNAVEQESISYVLNHASQKFHQPDCGSIQNMKASNRSDYSGSREELIAMGYTPCGQCKP